MKVDWDIVVGCVTAVLIAFGILAIGWYSVTQNTRMQEHYNTSFVECVRAGGEPLACHISLNAKQ